MIGKEESKTIQSTSSLDAKAAKENSDEIMKRMSKNIDISNQKVLETIEFLSHQSPDRDTTVNSTTDNFADNLATEAIEDAKIVLVVSQKPDIIDKPGKEMNNSSEIYPNLHVENNCERNEDEQEQEHPSVLPSNSENRGGNKDSILAWLSLSKHPSNWNHENSDAQKEAEESSPQQPAEDTTEAKEEAIETQKAIKETTLETRKVWLIDRRQ